MSTLSLETRCRYWKSLLQQEQNDDLRLLPGHAEELRTALRDALHELEQFRSQSLRWRDNWTGTVHADRSTSASKKVYPSTS